MLSPFGPRVPVVIPWSGSSQQGLSYNIPKLGWVARFESTEEAERVLLTAGFRFMPEERDSGREARASGGDRPAPCYS
jgi:hypothetical protein